MLCDDVVHVSRREVPESRPAQVLVRTALGVVARGEDPSLDCRAGAESSVLVEGLDLVETPEEEQIGDLLDDLQRIRDSP